MSYGTIPTVGIDGVPDPLPADLRVLDVREEVEWAHGHIEEAQLLPLIERRARIDELRDDGVLVVCKVGGRSALSLAFLQARGLDAVNLDGGMVDWAAAGRPMVSDTGREPHVV
jgi:rhodanese-related sulfurtransferase